MIYLYISPTTTRSRILWPLTKYGILTLEPVLSLSYQTFQAEIHVTSLPEGAKGQPVSKQKCGCLIAEPNIEFSHSDDESVQVRGFRCSSGGCDPAGLARPLALSRESLQVNPLDSIVCNSGGGRGASLFNQLTLTSSFYRPRLETTHMMQLLGTSLCFESWLGTVPAWIG